jgi:predicted esterase
MGCFESVCQSSSKVVPDDISSVKTENSNIYDPECHMSIKVDTSNAKTASESLANQKNQSDEPSSDQRTLHVCKIQAREHNELSVPEISRNLNESVSESPKQFAPHHPSLASVSGAVRQTSHKCTLVWLDEKLPPPIPDIDVIVPKIVWGHDINVDKKEIDIAIQVISLALDMECNYKNSRNIIIGGFGNLGALALSAGLQYPNLLGGIIVMSGFMYNNCCAQNNAPQYSEQRQMVETRQRSSSLTETKNAAILEPNKTLINSLTPILIYHGTKDTVIPFEYAQGMIFTLKTAHYNVESVSEETNVHDITDYGYTAMINFIREHMRN